MSNADRRLARNRLEYIQATIPILRRALPRSIDEFGRPVPVIAREPRPDFVRQELDAIGLAIPRLTRWSLETPEQYERRAIFYGRVLHGCLLARINDSPYRKARNDAVRRSRLREWIVAIRGRSGLMMRGIYSAVRGDTELGDREIRLRLTSGMEEGTVTEIYDLWLSDDERKRLMDICEESYTH